MSDNGQILDQIATISQQGVGPAIDTLVNHLRRERRYHELFDALLMQARHRLGLPLINRSLEEAPRQQRDALEAAYLDACREVGGRLLDEGEIRQGWMYLRPVGETEQVAEKLRAIEIGSENVEQIVEVALHEGVDPELGYRVLLAHYGTCNSITAFDSAVSHRPRSEQAKLAGMLVRHVYGELIANVRYDLERRGVAAAEGLDLPSLLALGPELLADGNYHLDVSHLSSTLRNARLITDQDDLRLAWQLADYGSRLGPTHQFKGDEPFPEPFPDSRLFFAAQLGQEVDRAVAFFAGKAELSIDEHGPLPAEVYVVLLSRLGRHDEAIAAHLKYLSNTRLSGFAPPVLDLAAEANRFDRVIAHCRERGDLLGYTTALLASK